LNENSLNHTLSKIEFHFLTLFPEIFPGVLNSSLLGKAQKKGLVSFHLTQLRDFATDKHRTVDDSPYGGGEGMLLKPDVLYSAWKSVVPEKPSPGSSNSVMTLLLSPQGQVFSQKMICGHYEGVDDRFIELCVDREVSIGNYVLTGGELPAMVIADTVTRLIPGVVGNERSLTQDSLENGLLKYPQYTRPKEFEGMPIPEILLSGDHGAIQAWREAQMRERTQKKRPDLWQSYLESKNKDKSGSI
jgi:tRNA (guanine37-N1)-methyltransferase